MFILYADKNRLAVQKTEPVTSGSVNVYQVRFTFSDGWDGLERTAVFKAGAVSRSVLLDQSGTCTVPWEVLSSHGYRLLAGVFGTRDGEIVLPTVWVGLGMIQEGVTPGEDAAPPTPDLLEQRLSGKADGLHYDGLNLSLMSGDKRLSVVQVAGGGEGGAIPGSEGPSGSAGGSPIGTIIAYMGTQAPEGYLVCDGSEYQISAYEDLAGHFKKQFGSISFFGGDGTSTFAVPDLRNMFLRGYHGEAEKKLSGDIGKFQEATGLVNFAVSGNNINFNADPDSQITEVKNVDDWDGTVGGAGYPFKRVQWHETAMTINPIRYFARPKNTAVLYCIKAV